MAPTWQSREHRPLPPDVEEPDISRILTEDDEPVDNIYSEKQQRLLVEPLYASWPGPRPLEDGAPRKFLAAANVGLFPAVHVPPLVPDVFLSLDVTPRSDLWEKRNRTYFFWEFGKPPEVTVEVVSNREGRELGEKVRQYGRMRIAHYAVWDPGGHLGAPGLHVFELRGEVLVPTDSATFAAIGLGLVAWEGEFEGTRDVWLRWCLPDGTLVATGAERAEIERQRAEAERQRAEAERQRAEAESRRAEAERERAEAERQRAARLAERLQALGIDPDEK